MIADKMRVVQGNDRQPGGQTKGIIAEDGWPLITAYTKQLSQA